MKKRMFKITALILSAVLLVTGTFYFTLAYLQAKSNPVVNTFTAGKINLTLKESEVDEYGNIKYYTADSFENGVLIGTPDFSLVEGVVGEGDETYDTVNLVVKNNYKLVPDSVYTKDPVVTVEKGSEPCFLYIAVYNGLDVKNYEGDWPDEENEPMNFEAGTEGAYKNIADQLSENGWSYLSTANWNGTPHGGYFDIYCYYDKTDATSGTYVVDAMAEVVSIPTFTEFKVNKEATSEYIEMLATDYNSDDEVDADSDLMSINTIEVYAFAVQSHGFSDSDAGVMSAWLAAFGK